MLRNTNCIEIDLTHLCDGLADPWVELRQYAYIELMKIKQREMAELAKIENLTTKLGE